MNHPVDNMHRKDNDQSMRPEGENHHMRQQCIIHQCHHKVQPPLMVIDIMVMHHSNKIDQGAPQTTYKTNHILWGPFLS